MAYPATTAMTDDARSAGRNGGAPIAFLFPAFPVLHQTFILWEVLALRSHGIPLEIYSIKQPSGGPQQPEAAELIPEVHYLPRAFSPAVLRSNLRALRRCPWRYLRVFGWPAGEWRHDRGIR